MNGNVPDAIGATVNPWSLVRSKLLLIMVPVAVLAITLLLGLAIWPSLRGEPTIIETQVIAMGDAALAAELNQVSQMESANDALDEAVLWRGFNVISRIDGVPWGARLDEMWLEVEALSAVREPDLVMDAAVSGNYVITFLVNNGWGSSGRYSYEMTLTDSDPNAPNGGNVVERETFPNWVCVDPGQVFFFAQLESRLRETAADGYYRVYLPYTLEVVGRNSAGNEVVRKSWVIDEVNGEYPVLCEDYDSADELSVKFARCVVDVAEPVRRVAVEGASLEKAEDGSWLVSASVLPTRSCKLRCRMHYSIGGASLATEEFFVVSKVPYYSDGAFNQPDGLAAKLASRGYVASSIATSIAEPYAYDAYALGAE